VGFLLAALLAMAQENLKTERFDRDPGWDGRNHRSTAHEPREVRQDFGWSAEAKAVGGTVSPDGDPAYYGKVLPASTLNDPLSASGTMIVGGDARPDGNTLLGFFNAETVNEWRTPSTLAFRVNGRGDGFHLHLEYCTARWRAGADFFGPIEASGKRAFRLFPGRRRSRGPSGTTPRETGPSRRRSTGRRWCSSSTRATRPTAPRSTASGS
jgi:hypothetical protein